MAKKWVYFFGGGRADGTSEMKELLGGKGANLAEMANLGMPVPPGFTITTEVCTCYYANKRKYPPELAEQVMKAIARIERIMGTRFGDPANPLLLSCRSGARRSMPGMMETVLNIGLTSKTIPGLIARSHNPRFVYDAYRRFIMMYSDVVMEKAAGIEPTEGQGIRFQLERIMNGVKEERGVRNDTDLTAEDLERLCELFKARVLEVLGAPIPDDPEAQLWGSIGAVFQSWNGKRAVSYRRIEGIPDEWGTATNVQAMVFGNMDKTSATGVGFTRDPATGDDRFYGEWLPEAQGEDVVAGIRTGNPLNEATRPPGRCPDEFPSLEHAMPRLYRELVAIRNRLEQHYRDMQDIEFTIEQGRLWMLQTRVGKRNGRAALRIALDMRKQRMIDAATAVTRVSPDQLDEWLHPILDPVEEEKATKFCSGLPAGPGGAVGQIVFTAADAVRWTHEGKKVVLVREETNPEDVDGMRAAVGILTARGGMTSHAALVARGWGKCCVVGAGSLHVAAPQLTAGGVTLREGDWISLNGSTGVVYVGQVPLIESEVIQVIQGRMKPEDSKDYRDFAAFLRMCDSVRRLKVRTNADSPVDAMVASRLGAEGIGLFRTEHMFYGEGSDEPLFYLRKMIVSKTEAERRAALDQLFPFCKRDVLETFKVMGGRPVTIRLLDPPLHEFVPEQPAKRAALAQSLNISLEELNERAKTVQEMNPMMGHRGVRLCITYPEIAEMQIRAILEAAAELRIQKQRVMPEIMIPVTCAKAELDRMLSIALRIADEVKKKYGLRKLDYLFGTMIELPRACVVAGQMAETAQFFSFGTNDLTQMGFGFSRDDSGSFLPEYLKSKALPADPFNVLDQEGIGQLIRMGIERGRATRSTLKVGICGEHGGEPSSVKFCHRVGMNYVSCSPYRVPIARLAAAQAVAEEQAASKKKAKAPARKKK